MNDHTITGVTLAAVATDPALSEESQVLLAASFLAVVNAPPNSSAVEDLAGWARGNGYYAEAVATLANMRAQS